ncbi:MAG: DciA family protein [Sphingorhabdus sp.]
MDKSKAPPPKGNSKKIAPKPYQRPRGGEARAVSDLMPEIGRAAFRRFGFVQSSVVSRWDEIVGTRYAAVSAPEAIRFPVGKKSEGTLELLVEGAHAPMMQHVIPEIIERVNRFFGYAAVAKVKVRQGAVARRSTPAPSATPQMLKPVPMELGDSLREIADPELVAVLESLAKSLAKGTE